MEIRSRSPNTGSYGRKFRSGSLLVYVDDIVYEIWPEESGKLTFRAMKDNVPRTIKISPYSRIVTIDSND